MVALKAILRFATCSATGHVSGSVSYRQIEIKAGGKISGTISTVIVEVGGSPPRS